MGLFDKIKGAFKKPEPVKVTKEKKPRKSKEQKTELTAKEKATQAGEPYIQVVKMEIDPNDINSGTFELDYNDKFVLNLIRAGYKFKDTDTDNDIVDRWWVQTCRNVALEVYENYQSDPSNRETRDLRTMQTKDLGNGRTEVS
jgi:hypothetical protein